MRLAICLTLAAFLNSVAFSQDSSKEQSVVAITNKSLPAVVLIQGITIDGSQIKASGFLFSTDGKIIRGKAGLQETQVRQAGRVAAVFMDSELEKGNQFGLDFSFSDPTYLRLL